MARNNLNEEDAMKKINSQMPLNLKVKKADLVIDNSESLKELKK
jgi:dephospho-CoA kinase